MEEHLPQTREKSAECCGEERERIMQNNSDKEGYYHYTVWLLFLRIESNLFSRWGR